MAEYDGPERRRREYVKVNNLRGRNYDIESTAEKLFVRRAAKCSIDIPMMFQELIQECIDDSRLFWDAAEAEKIVSYKDEVDSSYHRRDEDEYHDQIFGDQNEKRD